MQNQTNMDVFKKLAVVRRTNKRSGSIVSDDDFDDNGNNVCFHRHDNDSDTEMIDALVGETVVVRRNDPDPSTKEGFCNNAGASSPSLYGRRRNLDNMAVETSNRYDSDEDFSVVVRSMIHRYQHQNMSEMEAIHASLKNPEDLRAFVDTMNLRFSLLSTKMDDDENIGGDDTLSELVLRTRSIFDSTLKTMWREIDSLSSSPTNPPGSMSREESYERQQQHREEIAPELGEYITTQHPKAPKNLRMSPMLTSNFNYNNHGAISQSESIDSACSEGSNGSIFQSFKRRRRWFFPQSNKNERMVLPSTSSSSLGAHKPFTKKSPFPKFHFDFGRSTISRRNSKKRTFRNASLGLEDFGGSKPVQSLQLHDGLASSHDSMGNGNGNAMFMPPTSPIRKVSIEMKAIGDTTANN